LKTAQAKSTAFSSEYTSLIEVRDTKVFEMDNFKNYSMLCFTTLREKMMGKTEPTVEGTPIQDLAPAGA